MEEELQSALKHLTNALALSTGEARTMIESAIVRIERLVKSPALMPKKAKPQK